MNLFYAPDISQGIYSLPEEESRHCQKVLRLGEGEIIHLTDGKGTLYEACITDARSRQVVVEVTEKKEGYGRRPYRLHLAVAPTKNIDRFEWFLEKATEIGVDTITPLRCDHSERKAVRSDRLIKIITAAMKQSLKAYHPQLNEMQAFSAFIRQPLAGQHFIAHLDDQHPIHLKEKYRPGHEVTILIGPEGDFSEAEVAAARNASFEVVSLGLSRLRTETAAVVACHSIALMNE